MHLACVALGLALALPSLWVPFAIDDLFHLAILEGAGPAPLGWWELFTFSPGDPARRQMFVASGVLPWWAADLKLAFWRPLSSALVMLDHALFGRAPLGWHVHSLMWWAALLLSVGMIYRVRIEFPTPLEESEFRLLVWRRGGLSELPLPAVGTPILLGRP